MWFNDDDDGNAGDDDNEIQYFKKLKISKVAIGDKDVVEESGIKQKSLYTTRVQKLEIMEMWKKFGYLKSGKDGYIKNYFPKGSLKIRKWCYQLFNIKRKKRRRKEIALITRSRVFFPG